MNLMKSEKELLLDHQRLGHLRMDQDRKLYQPSPIKERPKSITEDSLPPCLTVTAKSPRAATCSRIMCLAWRVRLGLFVLAVGLPRLPLKLSLHLFFCSIHDHYVWDAMS